MLQKPWDISPEQQTTILREIETFFLEERNEEIGIIAAQQLLDFFLETLHKNIYNTAIDNVKDVVKRHVENMTIDIDILKQL